MRSTRMTVARAGLALGLQQGVGNAAVARMLAREVATAAPARPALKGGKELDAMLVKSSFFAPFIGPKMKLGTRAEGHVHVHDEEAFKAHALEYLEGKDNPKTGRVFTAEEAERFEPTLRGFQDDTGDVRIHERRADDGVVVHEAMHLFSSVAFVNAVGYSVNEGATEVFARRLASENGIMRAGFPQQHRLVAKLVAVVERWREAARGRVLQQRAQAARGSAGPQAGRRHMAHVAWPDAGREGRRGRRAAVGLTR